MARVTVFSKNRKAIETCVAILERLNHQVFSHHAVTKGFNFKYSLGNPAKETNEIKEALSEWLKGSVDFDSRGERNLMGLYLINLPFNSDDEVPDPPKNETYLKNEQGFVTNPENWKKGLSLL